MRFFTRLAAILCLALLTACASFPAPYAYAPVATDEGDYLVARYAALNNDPDEASLRYGKLIGAAPSQLGVAERAVYFALSDGDFTRAEALAFRAYTQGARAPVVMLTLGTGELRNGRKVAAVQHFRTLESDAAWRSLATDLIAWSDMKNGITGTPSAPTRALILFSSNDDAAALEAFQRLHAAPSRLAPTVKAHAELLSASGDNKAARELIAKATAPGTINSELAALDRTLALGAKLKPRRYTTKQGAALSLFLAGAQSAYANAGQTSVPLLTLTLALDPKRDDAKFLLAESWQSSERSKQARALFASIPARSPHYAAARSAMAHSLLKDGDADAALKLASQSLAAQPDAALTLDLAELHLELEQFAQAETVLDGLIQQSTPASVDWRAYFMRGAAREQQGNWIAARTDLETALKLSPGHPMILNYLGYAQADRGENLAGALSMIEDAVKQVPQSAAYADSLGWAHYQLGDFDKATTHLERAVSLNAADAVLNDHLGDAYWQTGRQIEARFQWQKALKAETDETRRAAIDAKLKSGLPRLSTSPSRAAVN